MPPILHTLNKRSILTNLGFEKKKELQDQYNPLYPEGMDLSPGSEQHDKIRDKILEYSYESSLWLSQKHEEWDKIDDMLYSHISLSDRERMEKNEDENVPVKIVVPQSYAILDTIITYMMQIFTTNPVMQFSSVGPEDELGAILLEHIVEAQVDRGRALLALDTFMRDGFSYGFGAAAVRWETKTGMVSKRKQRTVQDNLTGELVNLGFEKVRERETIFEGSVIEPINVRTYLPDPSVAIHEVQKGEFVGWKSRETYINLLRMENEQDSDFFNVRYLEGDAYHSCIYPNEDQSTPDFRSQKHTKNRRRDVIYMYMDVDAEELDLPGTGVQRWLFALANDAVVVKATRVDLDHEMFPVVICAPDLGGHEVMPVSRLGLMHGLQVAINNFYNARNKFLLKSLNNNAIVDPSLVNMKDWYKNTYGGPVRLRKNAWGRGVNDAANFFNIPDLTRNNIPDMLTSADLANTVTGATDAVQGVQRTSGERVTKAEFLATRGSALSRLQRAALKISQQSIKDLGYIFAKHTQQFMTEETYIKIAGRWEHKLRTEFQIADPNYRVTPFDISVNFDVRVSDGSIAGGENIADWNQLWQTMTQHPELLQNIDATRVFLHISRLLGVKNAHEFLRKTPIQSNVVPDEVAAEQRQAGGTTRVG